jgi:uncharacterized protein
MTLSMYEACVPVYSRALKALAAILTKAEAHAEARKIDPSVFLTARLAPDMYPLTKQVQVVSDGAKGTAARLTGLEVPSFPDTETSFAELQARIKKTLDFIESVPSAAFDGAETRQVTLSSPRGSLSFTGKDFLLNFGLPNLYFHVTTAYNILRHNGVELGKGDFIGGR